MVGCKFKGVGITIAYEVLGGVGRGLDMLGLSYKVSWELRSGHDKIACLKG
jgi:hypothetical protein